MEVPFLDLKIQYKSIKEEVLKEIHSVLDNTSYILGKYVSNFENEFASIHNSKYCFGVSSGTDGNHLVLWALGINPRDEIIIPVNTFIATAWGATLCGATPVFVDCDPESYNINPQHIEAVITPKTKAIVAVHLYGQPADMDNLRTIANKYNLHLVEDCAQAHLSEYKGKKVGGLGIASSFSFYPGKNLGAYGEAGAVVTNNDDIANKVKMMRDHGSHQKYSHLSFGHNYRMEAIQGAVLGIKLKYLEQWTEGRRRVASKYNQLLKDVEEIRLPKELPSSKHVYHLFVVQVEAGQSESRNIKRDNLQKYLSENGVSTGLHYPIPLHLQPCFNYLNYKKGDFPIAEKLAEQGLSLPMFPELTDTQIEYVCDKIKDFFGKKK
jgi:dTDP-4-amino-4,6-dideoxygalactose transaminase